MSGSRALRVGVAGVGSLGFHHARIVGGVKGATLAGIHDTRAERLAEVAELLEARPFDTLEGLLDGCDALVVAVPTLAHERVAVDALRRGVHVLIEKPIAATIGQADRILDAAAGSGALVQIGHIERFNAALRACEPYLDEPLFVESHRLAPFGPRGTDVAVVLDLMIHDVDLVLSLVHREVTSIAASGVPVLTTSPDIASARLEFHGGAVANLTASRVSMERMRKIRLFQRSGYLSLDLAAGRGEFLRLRQGALPTTGGAWEGGLAGPSGGVGLEDIVERIEISGDGVEPLKAELESFVAAALGRGPVTVSGEDGRRALAVALQIVERIQHHVVDTHPA